MTHFLDMGGYAEFVWPAYLLSVIALALLAVWVLREGTKARNALERVETAGKVTRNY